MPAAVGCMIVLAFLGGRHAWPDPFDRLRLAAEDLVSRLHPWQPEASRVLVADIDDASLRRLGQWPWPRSTVAALVRRLQDLGAAAIAFDVVFAEPDRTSPATLAAEWRQRFGWQAPTGTLPDFDAELAAAVARGRVVAGFGLVGERTDAVPALPAGFATIGANPVATVARFVGAVPNLPVIGAAAAGAGSFSIVAGHDQVIRALPMLSALNDRLVPSLALEALRVASDEDTIGVRAERGAGVEGPVTGYTAKVGDTLVPLERDGTFLLHHGPALKQPSVPAWRLVDDATAPALASTVKGRIVLVGTSALGLADLRATPLNPLEPGVNIHAHAIEQVLAGHFLSRPPWAVGAETVLAVLLGFGLAVLGAWAPLRLAAAGAVITAAALLGGAWLAFTQGGLVLDLSVALPVVLGSAIATALARYLVAERDALALRSAFKHYLAPALVDQLARDPKRLSLGGELRTMTFLFTDLEGFTRLMEDADPVAAVTLLNGYLDGLSAVAMDHGGTLDKMVGDALHVMFNAPLDQPDHAARAVRCALAMDRFAQGFAAARRAEGFAFGVTRIGVNTGAAVVGNFGGHRRFDYTAHGDAINTAARLESANKALGTRLCVSAATATAAPEFGFLPVGTLMLKGKARGVEVFLPVEEEEAWGASYRTAYAALVGGDETAGLAIVALHREAPDHPVLALHARRIGAGERGLRLAA